ncbi:hypothetical protein SAMN04488034_10617 [Salinimicrobium catena]|uniref:Uncharacterized protein n=2 Tax=Salinimicrobium catena TaxID=390640 RepID=A0A1H5NWU0_9FLAO|nr:hypothetical protein [Salinimicrobium catena]SDL61237.1 hypothetical protein SAMN04488140_10697 [Salinimicrobium catena]SEF05291.1 hypothetical protein SAMN04488034_10617 [Salinimicrobium catena]
MNNKLAAVIMVISGFIFTGCSQDTDPIIDVPVVEVDNELNGQITEDVTLDPSVEYTLTGSYEVLAGATLTIPAGTKIVAEKGTEVYIAIHQDADIVISGTESNPVIMTSASKATGDWGGLVILGKGITTEGTNVTAEVGGFQYGGTDNADSSGSIEYLVIEGAGAQINADSQYNGLTLYAVGSGTNISNVAIQNGADDGVEFFGGAVSVTGLYLENNEDDAVDWTEGWNGTITNVYVLHTIEGFSTAIEADGVNNNPTIVNFTAVSTTGGTALQFKKESGATFEGLSLTGYDTSIDMKDNGPLANVYIEQKIADPESNYTTPSSTSQSSFDWINNRSSVESSILHGAVEGRVELDASVTYSLNSSYIVQEGGELVIPAGTKIIARDGGTDVYIAVLKGGKIDIQGTEANPVVISSTEANPGDWGGLTIVGNATTTEGVDAVAEVGGFKYGGNEDADNSGSIKNLVIAGTGAQINSESQYNGISFYAVGSGTVVENIAVINGADDGVEFFGGSVSATNLYLENNEDDAVDWTEGWNGTVTNVYVNHSIDTFSTAVEADGANNNPQLVNFTAVSTTGGTALQFKKESGATFSNLYLEGYTDNIDMRDGGALSNIQIDGADATTDGNYTTGSKVDISAWIWIEASL